MPAKHNSAKNKSGNSRKRKTSKHVRSQNRELELQIPRDCYNTFEPILFAKSKKQLNDFNGRIISLHSRGLTTLYIQGHIKDIYGVDIFPGFISQVTHAEIDKVKR